MTTITIQADPSGKIKCKLCHREVHYHEIHRHAITFHQD